MACTQGLHPGTVLCLLSELRELANTGQQEGAGQAHRAGPRAGLCMTTRPRPRMCPGSWIRAKLESSRWFPSLLSHPQTSQRWQCVLDRVCTLVALGRQCCVASSTEGVWKQPPWELPGRMTAQEAAGWAGPELKSTTGLQAALRGSGMRNRREGQVAGAGGRGGLPWVGAQGRYMERVCSRSQAVSLRLGLGQGLC